MVDLTPIANALISLLALLVTAFVIPYIKAKISAEKLTELQKWTKIAVSAAEMIYKESGAGQYKKRYVQEYLNSKGYSLDVDTVDALIESAVHDMHLLDPVPMIEFNPIEGDDVVEPAEDNTETD